MQDEGRNVGRRTIKVLLADDHTMFRQGIAGVLDTYAGMEVVGQTTNDEAALELAHLTKPDVVLMQVQMPLSKAKASLLRMRQIHPSPKVVIVTMIEDPHYIKELMDVGVSAYVVKSASAEHLVAAVRTAILDPKSKNVVVGICPLRYWKKRRRAQGAFSRPESLRYCSWQRGA